MFPIWTLEAIEAEIDRCNRDHHDQSNKSATLDLIMCVETPAFLEQPIQRCGLVGILFARPEVPLAKTDIIPQIDYFHHLTGKKIGIFCPGYSAYGPIQRAPDQHVINAVDNNPWFFSNAAFLKVCREIESRTNWNYSGETDLILLGAADRLSFKQVLAIHLEQAIKDAAIPSVVNFMTQFVGFFDNYEGEDYIWDLSDWLGLKTGRSSLLKAILPQPLYKFFASARHFAAQDISR